MTIGENELIASREYDVPQELVYRAWTTPDLLAKWWGPKGFKNTFHECEMRPGGTWKFTMHGPDGVDYPNHNVFVEFVPTERVVIDHLNVHEFRVTATLKASMAAPRSPSVNVSRNKRILKKLSLSA